MNNSLKQEYFLNLVIWNFILKNNDQFLKTQSFFEKNGKLIFPSFEYFSNNNKILNFEFIILIIVLLVNFFETVEFTK